MLFGLLKGDVRTTNSCFNISYAARWLETDVRVGALYVQGEVVMACFVVLSQHSLIVTDEDIKTIHLWFEDWKWGHSTRVISIAIYSTLLVFVI